MLTIETMDTYIIEFYKDLSKAKLNLVDVEVMNPFIHSEVSEICRIFYNRYYHDFDRRIFMIAINPGRFGAGITGLSFTDPVILENEISIPNSFVKKNELSAVFFHELIAAFGGHAQFYNKFYLTSVSPLGFTQKGRNLNYYDIPSLQEELTPFIVAQMDRQVAQWANPEIAFSIGKGENHKALIKLNQTYKWFDKIVPIPHPRWVMQYKRKYKSEIIRDIINTINKESNIGRYYEY